MTLLGTKASIEANIASGSVDISQRVRVVAYQSLTGVVGLSRGLSSMTYQLLCHCEVIFAGCVCVF